MGKLSLKSLLGYWASVLGGWQYRQHWEKQTSLLKMELIKQNWKGIGDCLLVVPSILKKIYAGDQKMEFTSKPG